MINIAKKAEQVLETLRKEGFNELRFPEIKKEMPENWSKDQALFYHAYYAVEGYLGDFPPYFDDAAFKYDFEEYLKKEFPGCRVQIYWQAQEIIISR